MNSDITLIKKDVQSIKGSIKKLIQHTTSPKLETQVHEQKLKIELLQNNINTLSQNIIQTQTENKFISESLEYNKREVNNKLQTCKQLNLKTHEQNLLIQKHEININSLQTKLDTQNEKYKDFNNTLNQNIIMKERLVFWIEKYEIVQKDFKKCNQDKDKMSKQTKQMSQTLEDLYTQQKTLEKNWNHFMPPNRLHELSKTSIGAGQICEIIDQKLLADLFPNAIIQDTSAFAHSLDAIVTINNIGVGIESKGIALDSKGSKNKTHFGKLRISAHGIKKFRNNFHDLGNKIQSAIMIYHPNQYADRLNLKEDQINVDPVNDSLFYVPRHSMALLQEAVTLALIKGAHNKGLYQGKSESQKQIQVTSEISNDLINDHNFSAGEIVKHAQRIVEKSTEASAKFKENGLTMDNSTERSKFKNKKRQIQTPKTKTNTKNKNKKQKIK